MADQTVTPTARQRPKRTRTKRTSGRQPLVVSTLPPNQVELLPGAVTLVCPDCTTWVPVTGVEGTPKLVPHDTKPAGEPGALRCLGINRLVVIDLTITEWAARLGDGIADAASRRPTAVRRKPKTPAAPPATRLTPVAPRASTAWNALTAHRRGCTACTGRAYCQDGITLADTYARLLRQEPARRQRQQAWDRERRTFDRGYQEEARKRQADMFADQAPADRSSAKGSGTAAEDASNVCRTARAGAVSEFRGPEVPLSPTRISQ